MIENQLFFLAKKCDIDNTTKSNVRLAGCIVLQVNEYMSDLTLPGEYVKITATIT